MVTVGAESALLDYVVGETTPSPPSGSISANPNPCAAAAGSSSCTSAITWTTQNVTQARVYVSANGGGELLFASGTVCAGQACAAPWIPVGGTVTFTLYD